MEGVTAIDEIAVGRIRVLGGKAAHIDIELTIVIGDLRGDLLIHAIKEPPPDDL